MPDFHDTLLGAHVAAGSLGLALGLVVIRTEWITLRPSRAGAYYHWAVLAVALTALALVALDWPALGWFAPLALLAYGLALLGRVAWTARGGDRARMYAHGQGGSYIALVTALLVTSAGGGLWTWVLPTLLGLPLIEWQAHRMKRGSAGATTLATRGST